MTRSGAGGDSDQPGRRAGLCICGPRLIAVWFPYWRRFLLVIFNLSGTIAVRAVFTIIYPTTAITMWTDLHCRLRYAGGLPAGCRLNSER
jgi:hypothetical protein